MLDWLTGLDVVSAEFVVSAWVVTGLVLIAAVLAARRRWATQSRARRCAFGTLCGVAVVVVGLVASAASVNAYYAFLPTVGDVAQAATGDRQWVPASELDRFSRSTALRADKAGLVVKDSLPADRNDGFGPTANIIYLPPQYFTEPETSFPVVYLFHGSPGRPQDWFHAGRAQQAAEQIARAGHPVIVVAPQVSRSWTDDPECVDGDREKVETHLFDDVIPHIDGRFRTVPDRDGRIFAGMSAGGYCALNLGLRHRDAVATIVDLSGETRPTHTGGAATLFGRANPADPALVAANSPADYATTVTNSPPIRIWLDSGTDDHSVITQMSALDRVLRERDIDTVWRVRPGGHTYWVWTKALREALPWAVAGVPGSISPPSRPGPG